MSSHDGFSIRQLILVPALISLGVTILRLVGELKQWSPLLFRAEAGGFGALVGIVWLVPIFGIYFALKLVGMGRYPDKTGRVVLFALLSLVVFFAIGSVSPLLGMGFPFDFIFMVAGALAAVVICLRGWPDLNRTLLAYGLAARVPVIVVMFFAILGNWGTHYDLPPPDFPAMSAIPKFFWLGLLPQLSLWIAFTSIVGSLFGGIALAVTGHGKTTS